MDDLADLIAVIDRFLADGRSRMEVQRGKIRQLTDEGKSAKEHEALLAIFGDIEEKLLDYRRCLESEMTSKRVR